MSHPQSVSAVAFWHCRHCLAAGEGFFGRSIELQTVQMGTIGLAQASTEFQPLIVLGDLEQQPIPALPQSDLCLVGPWLQRAGDVIGVHQLVVEQTLTPSSLPISSSAACCWLQRTQVRA